MNKCYNKTIFFIFTLCFRTVLLIKDDFLCNSTHAMLLPNFICFKNKFTFWPTESNTIIPLIVDSDIVIFDVTDIDETGNSISLYMQLGLTWLDEGMKMMRNNGPK